MKKDPVSFSRKEKVEKKERGAREKNDFYPTCHDNQLE